MLRPASIAIPALVFLNVLSGTLLIPAVRPFFATLHGAGQGAMHAFFTVNMLGAAVGAPLACLWAERTNTRRPAAIGLSVIDAGLLMACALGTTPLVILVARTLQGVASVGALSLLMGELGGSGNQTIGRRKGSAAGMAGSAIVLAIAAGAPVGGLALRWGPRAPLALSAAFALVVAAGTAPLVFKARPRQRKTPRSQLLAVLNHVKVPALWVGAERFAVGCFVVTFGLFAHGHGFSDGDVARLYSLLLIPFALASYPLTRLSDRLGRVSVLGAGAFLYGSSFILLSLAAPSWFAALLFAAGVSSAAIYGPSLVLASTLPAPGSRATAMGVVNGAGTLGMMLGTATAGIGSAVLQHSGMGSLQAQAWVLRGAGLSQLVLLVAGLHMMRQLSQSSLHRPQTQGVQP